MTLGSLSVGMLTLMTGLNCVLSVTVSWSSLLKALTMSIKYLDSQPVGTPFSEIHFSYAEALCLSLSLSLFLTYNSVINLLFKLTLLLSQNSIFQIAKQGGSGGLYFV